MGGLIFLTGGTGFLGTQIARRIVSETDHRLVVLVQAPDPETAALRAGRAFWDWPELRDAVGARVAVLAGDVSERHFGLPEDGYERLVHGVTHVIHAAADIRLGAPLEALEPVNVGGTVQVIELARAAHANHGLRRLSHVSTAYVAGRTTGVVDEGPPTAETGFTNHYERTKFEAEWLVHAVSSELPVSVFRPAMIVGDSRTGAILTFNTFYQPIRHFLMNRERLVPAGSDLRINIIPVDYVADCIVRLTFAPAAAGLTFHLTAPHDSLPTVDALLSAVREWESEKLGVRPPHPLPLPFELGAPLLRVTEAKLATLLPYFNERRIFRRDNVDRLLGPYELDWREYLPHLLDYAADRGFMHNSGRTVHEQVLFRLASHAGRMTFHDIVDGETRTRDSRTVRAEMLAAAGALRGLGIGKGDRVAIVGLNSSRYLSLDVAIGLCGAVSVPMYYTSPPAEVEAILRSSRAKVLLVGAPAILRRLSEIDTDVPVVSFGRERSVVPDAGRDVIAWEDFLSLGDWGAIPAEAPVGLGDVATLRFTSGTTGAPKGTVFTHANLRWMAQAVVALLPWSTRKGANRYLSFLPMNHVVEGILCSYAAYDLPGEVDIYFLEDFHALAGALHKVRPTIFFAVPRIYEKAWQRAAGSGIGRLASRLPHPVEGPAVREILLRGAGLDRCEQLLVGSAPLSESLLEAYRSVGIEIHNAYGMTEAPIVSLNRAGRNRLGTVGEPLPGTDVRIAPDGEILVRGPQVAAGYDDPAIPPPLEDGWLRTGDIGHMTDDGYLVVDGRRKEMIATSYAKKIAPEKVEVVLRAIPGVAEAMLVGEGRPYCSALIWMEGGAPAVHEAEAVDAAVRDAVSVLAPPERPRRWAVLPNELSVEGGELTANLKVKRAPVLRRYADLIDGLYAETGGRQGSEGSVHVADIEAFVPVAT